MRNKNVFGNYKVLIIAAGMGTRISAITSGISKCMLQVNGKPVLQHTCDSFSSKGAGEITIVIGHSRESIEDNLVGKLNFVFNPDYANSGVLQSFFCAKHLKGQKFLFTPGDHFFDRIVLDMFENFDSDVGVIIERKKCDDEDVKTVIKDEKLFFGKQFAPDEAVGELTGLMIFNEKASKRAFEILEERIAELKDRYVFHLLMILQEEGFEIRPLYCESSKRIEIDYPKDHAKANELAAFFK